MGLRCSTRTALLVACSALCCAGCAEERPPRVRPNIILLVIDTLRADRLPFYAEEAAQAPFLAELAARSVVFERAWSTSSWTPPAAASLFTGVYPNQHGVVSSIGAFEKTRTGAPQDFSLNRIPSELETIPEFLDSQGYRTFAVTDNPNICEAMGFASGFDRFQNFDYRGAAGVNEVLAGWREEILSAEPWFVYLHYMDPHIPYHKQAPWYRPPPEEAAEHVQRLAAYDSEIAYCDSHIRQAFELLGAGDETLVIFTADHGEEFGDHGGWNHLFQLYSELTRVPLVLHHPGVEPRRVRVQEHVSLVDVLPTLRPLLGAPPSPQDAGRDLGPYYLGDLGEAPVEERAVLAMRLAHSSEKAAVLLGDHKLVVTQPAGDKELYDLAADPGEQRNLAAEHPELVSELKQHLRRFQEGARRWKREFAETSVAEEQLERLRELGYAGESGLGEEGDH